MYIFFIHFYSNASIWKCFYNASFKMVYNLSTRRFKCYWTQLILYSCYNLFYFSQIRHIRELEGSNSHAVQQGEVSSSNPNILSNDQVGPILLEVQFNLNRISSIHSVLVTLVHWYVYARSICMFFSFYSRLPTIYN